MCFRQLSLDPGLLEVIAGENGEGKTAILKALRMLFGAEFPESAVTVGQERGEIRVQLDVAGETYAARCSFNADGRRAYEVKDGTGRKLPGPGQWLSRLASLAQLNPIHFAALGRGLTAGKREQVEMLMQACPLALTPEILSGYAIQVPPTLLSGHGLQAVQRVIDHVAAQQTLNNTEIGKLEAILSLSPAPPDRPADVETAQLKLDQLRAQERDAALAWQSYQQRQVQRQRISTEITTAESRLQQLQASIPPTPQRSTYRLEIEQLQAHELQHQTLIVNLEAQLQQARANLTTVQQQIKGYQQAEAQALQQQAAISTAQERIRGEQERVSGLRSQLATIDQDQQPGPVDQITVAVRAAQLAVDQEREIQRQHQAAAALATQRQQLHDRQQQADLYRLQLKALRDELPRKLLEQAAMPAGLTVDGDSIRWNGVPFSDVNEAKQVEIACEVIMRLAEANGQAKILLIDGAESLGQAAVEAIMLKLKERPDWQAWVCTVPISYVSQYATHQVTAGQVLPVVPQQ